eukprot:CAMPEP_0174325578 /NCGR_PEP_ID=MMETSP0810-20121108/13329_1 /TAXON_ID=73025 ORGANISM="Eutreptiella gymnastica-like, Strain CCMP1594" /NCGR_SAMPLE_ID=MMETSP0810 /ASSEMBLY_ACC=CAM_ASM_000659 /LENGTH=94 /DNA_ID=CAMNT_0015438909 /DNA_START=898 /DNA_END=1179 /DNA_ORIENTATION=-
MEPSISRRARQGWWVSSCAAAVQCLSDVTTPPRSADWPGHANDECTAKMGPPSHLEPEYRQNTVTLTATQHVKPTLQTRIGMRHGSHMHMKKSW